MIKSHPVVSLVLVALSLVACASTPERSSAPSATHGVLGSGGSLRLTTSHGTQWVLALQGAVVVLEVNDGRATFLGGAPGGRLEYEHVEATSTWRLQLAAGAVTCQGQGLLVVGRHHRIGPGVELRFDADGSLVVSETAR